MLLKVPPLPPDLWFPSFQPALFLLNVQSGQVGNEKGATQNAGSGFRETRTCSCSSLVPSSPNAPRWFREGGRPECHAPNEGLLWRSGHCQPTGSWLLTGIELNESPHRLLLARDGRASSKLWLNKQPQRQLCLILWVKECRAEARGQNHYSVSDDWLDFLKFFSVTDVRCMGGTILRSILIPRF